MKVARAHAYSSWGKSLAPFFLVTVLSAIHAHVCTLYFHMTLQCDRENHEHLKYLRNVYRVMTNQLKSGHVNWPQNHKITNVLACGLVFSRWIGFSLAGQWHSRNISGVHALPGLTVIFLSRIWFIHNCMVMKGLNEHLQ